MKNCVIDRITSLKEELSSIMTDRRTRSIALWTLFFSFLAHGFRWFNTSFNHDSLFIYHHHELRHQIYLGRWLAPLWLFLRGEITVPVLFAFFSICFTILANILLIKMLDIRKRQHIILLCALLPACQTVTLLYSSFMYTVDVYMLSFLLSVLAVWLFLQYRQGWIPASFCFAGSMALYPSYAEVTILLLMFLMIKNYICDKEPITKSGKGGKMIAFLLLGGIMYYVGWLVSVRILNGTGVSELPTAGEYNSVSRMMDLRISSLPELLKGTYLCFWHFVTFPETVHPRLFGIFNLLIAAGTCILLITSNRKPLRLIPVIGLFLLIPLGANFVYVLTGGMVHTLMVFSFSFLYAGAIMCLEFTLSDHSGKAKRRIQSITRILVTICLIVIACHSIIFANQCHVRRELEYQATLSAMTRVIDRMEKTEGFDPVSTPVIFLGDLNKSVIAQKRGGYGVEQPGNLTNISYSTTYYETIGCYFQFALGYPIQTKDRNTAEQYTEMDEVVEMPAFPSAGCTRMIGDVLVVKLSEDMSFYSPE